MEKSLGFGLMAVCAVSGSMVILVHQVHKRLFSHFMQKFEFEMGGSDHKHQTKKKVRFSEQVSKLAPGNKVYRRNLTQPKQAKDGKVLIMEDVVQKRKPPTTLEDIMPPNRAVLYRGIMKYRNLKGHFHF